MHGLRTFAYCYGLRTAYCYWEVIFLRYLYAACFIRFFGTASEPSCHISSPFSSASLPSFRSGHSFCSSLSSFPWGKHEFCTLPEGMCLPGVRLGKIRFPVLILHQFTMFSFRISVISLHVHITYKGMTEQHVIYYMLFYWHGKGPVKTGQCQGLRSISDRAQKLMHTLAHLWTSLHPKFYGFFASSYMINFRIPPYFKCQFIKEIHVSPYFVVSYDESLNRIVQHEQMDIRIRYWNELLCVVETHYFDSQFLKPPTKRWKFILQGSQ